MKKIITLFALIVLCASCKKNKCYVIVDCIGNDLQNYCGSKSEVDDYCASHSSPGCTWTYREQ